ncbi:uncharacterized protein [Littorina saxatilis]
MESRGSIRVILSSLLILIFGVLNAACGVHAAKNTLCQTVSPLTHSIPVGMLSPPYPTGESTHVSGYSRFIPSPQSPEDVHTESLSDPLKGRGEKYASSSLESSSAPVSRYNTHLLGSKDYAAYTGFQSSASDRRSVLRFSSSSPVLNCSVPERLVGVQVRHHLNRRMVTVGLFICPAVKVLQLQIVDGKGHFVHLPVKVTVTSCAHTNDTAIISKGRHRLHITLRLTVGHSTSALERLNYSYSLHEGSSGLNRQKNAEGPKPEEDHDVAEMGSRWKRSVKDQVSTVMPASANNNDTKQESVAIGTTEGCGQSKTCIRYGTEGCGHLTCDYMLSYRVINSTEVDVELSARGTGWVAIGFSSDKFMGGGDDVMGCKQERKLSPQVVAMSLGNSVKHSPPQEKENRLTLLAGRLEDDHIYCRVRRPLQFKERIADSDLDLFNDWHQLYAFGDIDGSGRMLQHTQEPRVSERKITMVRVTDIMVVTSSASLPLSFSCLLSLLFPLTLTFTGS